MADDKDRLREFPVRLLGYTNEVGEAFRPLVRPKVVHTSYALAAAYVLSDTAWRAHVREQCFAHAHKSCLPPPSFFYSRLKIFYKNVCNNFHSP